MSKKNKHKNSSENPQEQNELINSQDQAIDATTQKVNKEILKKMVQNGISKGKTVGKNVQTKVKAKVKDIAENRVIAENIKKFTPTDENQRQKLKGIFLMLVGILALLFVGVFLVNKIFRSQSIAEMVPADNTIGFFEMNTDGGSSQVQQLFQILQKYPAYQPQELINLFNLVMPVDKNELSPWFGRKAGVALVQSPSQPNELTPIVFIEMKDRQKALAFFQSRVLKNSNDDLLVEPYNGFDFYTYRLSQPYSFFFLNQYVVLATNRQTLRELSDSQKQSKKLLNDDETFRKVANNLPPGGLGFGYVNVAKFFDALAKNSAYTTRKARELLVLQPFLRLFAAKGISINVGDKNFQFQVFSSLDPAELKGSTYLTYNDKYQGKLLEFADQGTLLLSGGHDLNKELNRLDEIFTAGTKTSSLFFQGILEAQKQKYLGKDISLADDIYPLLKGEYLITVSKDLTKPEVSVMLELPDKNNDLLRIEKIVNAFIKISAIFEPKIQEVTLPDGTKGQEVVASPEQVTRTDEAYEGVNIATLHMGKSESSIHYAVVMNNTLLVNTSLDGIHRLIDRATGKQKDGLKNSDEYRNSIQPIFGSADQVMQLQVQPIFDMLGIKNDDTGKIYQPFIAPFQSISTTKNFFQDGISELYLLNVK